MMARHTLQQIEMTPKLERCGQHTYRIIEFQSLRVNRCLRGKMTLRSATGGPKYYLHKGLSFLYCAAIILTGYHF